jgi:putative nucleotidyltransferase with HDIG domain
MKPETVTDFDLYINVGGHLVLYAPNPYHWSKGELERLKTEGHDTLFFQKGNEERVSAYQKISVIPQIEEGLPPHHRIQSITQVAAEFSKILYEHPLSDSTLSKGRQIIDSLISCIQENVTCVSALGHLATHDEYTYYHSGRVAAYATAIAMQMTLSDRNLLEELALGCLLHDVGKSKIDAKILGKPGPLTPAEWDLVRKHTQWGIEITKDANLDIVPTEVVLHHHERADGRGYPHGLGRHELLDEVTIASFADLFDALTTVRPYQQTRTRYEALDFIRHHMIEQINKDAFKAMVEIFR